MYIYRETDVVEHRADDHAVRRQTRGPLPLRGSKADPPHDRNARDTPWGLGLEDDRKVPVRGESCAKLYLHKYLHMCNYLCACIPCIYLYLYIYVCMYV